MSLMKAIGFSYFFMGWLKRARADGEITTEELLELVHVAADIFEIKELQNIVTVQKVGK